ncbi:MAG: hypothetical protein HXK25_05665 [Lancefieldella rimae]|nr:hypothetical protein [Lancefieldella rimae]
MAFVKMRNKLILTAEEGYLVKPLEEKCLMNFFEDKEHDPDSCRDVWDGLYKKVYPQFFDKYFDFSHLSDRDTKPKCKRWYITLKKDIEASNDYPKFKMAGDCIFNFNDIKVKKFKKWVNESEEEISLLNKCRERHHKFENFAFMPITGGMNNQKEGRQSLDRPDIHISELQKYFNSEESKIFSNAGNNKEALEWYLSIFEKNIYKYFNWIYLIDDRDFIDKKFLPFVNKEIVDENSAIQYMNLAIEFWDLRKKNIDKYCKTN